MDILNSLKETGTSTPYSSIVINSEYGAFSIKQIDKIEDEYIRKYLISIANVKVRDTLKSETNKTAKRNIEKAASSGSKKGLETFLYKEKLYQDNLEAFDLCETKYKKIIGRKIDIKNILMM